MLAPNQENALQKLSQSEAHHKLGIHWGGLTRDFGGENDVADHSGVGDRLRCVRSDWTSTRYSP